MKLTQTEAQEERAEMVKYRLYMAWLFTLMATPAVSSSWALPYKMLFLVGAVIYYVGFWHFYPAVYESSMKDHPMRHSSGYRMTDGHAVAIAGAICWPFLAPMAFVIRGILRAISRRRSTTEA